MRKRLILGDVHGRFDKVKNAYELTKPDDVIILGDYVDSHDWLSDERQYCALLDVLNLQKSHINANKGNFILLLGNHDFQYLYNDPIHERYSCFSRARLKWAYPIFKKNTETGTIQAIYVDEKNHIIYSHAGVSATWMKNNDLNLAGINDMLKHEELDIFKFVYGKYYSDTGDSKESSCIWIRPNSLINDMCEDWQQVVGHTPVKSIFGLTNTNEDTENLLTARLILCDNLESQCVLETLDDEDIVVSRNIVNF